MPELTKEIHGVSMGSSGEQHMYFKTGNQSQFYHESAPITTLQSHAPPSSFKPILGLNSKTNTAGSISRKKVSEHISKGLCRFCGEKWEKIHRNKCKVWKKLNALFVSQDKMEEKDDSDKDDEMDLITHSLELLPESIVHVSLHALQGMASGCTLQLTGMTKNQRVPFLMDTCSTHNFISEKWMKSLGLKTIFINVFLVIVALDR